MLLLSHHRTQGAGAFWRAAGTAKHAIKNDGTGSGMVRSSPFPVPMLLLLWQELHRPPCRREQESPQCLVTFVPTPCYLPRGWREPLAREAGDLGPCVWKNPLCLLSLACATEGHLCGLGFCLEESGREPQE